jgi:DinB superfamily
MRIGRTVLGRAHPYHRLGLPPDHRIGEPDPAVDVSAWDIDVFAAASLDEVLDARHDRMGIVRGVVDGLAPRELQQTCGANPAPGFPPSTVIPVGFCIDLVIGEEWAHHEFATRDLAMLKD